MADLRAKVGSVELATPVIAASGTYGYGVYSEGHDNLTVKNGNLSYLSLGIAWLSITDSLIEGVITNDNGGGNHCEVLVEIRRQIHEEKHRERVEQQVCQHYWVIESALNRVSVGVCRLCAEEKEFNNLISDCVAEANGGLFQRYGYDIRNMDVAVQLANTS